MATTTDCRSRSAHHMPDRVNRDRLDRLRADLADLRARTTAQFGPAEDATAADGADPARRARAERVADVRAAAAATSAGSGAVATSDAQDDGASDDRLPTSSTTVEHRTRRQPAPLPRLRRSPKPPRPPRRLRRPRVRRPPSRFAVPTPIAVSRRPSWVAPPRVGTWDAPSALVAIAVLLPASLQLGYRLVQAMFQTSAILGADPTRSDHLHAAAGVAGGGITLAAAVAAVAIAKNRPGYLAGAVGVVLAFCVLPHLAYTANAGIVAASIPQWSQMIAPPQWPRSGALTATFWLAVVALVAAAIDLVWRSAHALWRTHLA
jgi:hypothetical protein